MKKVLISVLSAILLAVPAVMTSAEPGSAYSLDKKKVNTVTVAYNVNMHCDKCVAKLTDNLSFLKGVEDLKVSLDEKTVVITYNPAKTDEATLVKAIERCGYTAEKQEPEKEGGK